MLIKWIILNLLSWIISCTKLLADWLSNIASKVVSHNQFDFIRGRNIQNCIFAALECVNFLDKNSFGGNIALKVDIRKTFDSLRWPFILEVLKMFGFWATFCDWIANIFLSAHISILFYGSPEGYFKCSCGVRQGDLLSPFLFGLAKDYFSRLLLQLFGQHKMILISSLICVSSPTHLLYYDDILIFFFVIDLCQMLIC